MEEISKPNSPPPEAASVSHDGSRTRRAGRPPGSGGGGRVSLTDGGEGTNEVDIA